MSEEKTCEEEEMLKAMEESKIIEAAEDYFYRKGLDKIAEAFGNDVDTLKAGFNLGVKYCLGEFNIQRLPIVESKPMSDLKFTKSGNPSASQAGVFEERNPGQSRGAGNEAEL
jgi:hypothetical protein